MVHNIVDSADVIPAKLSRLRSRLHNAKAFAQDQFTAILQQDFPEAPPFTVTGGFTAKISPRARALPGMRLAMLIDTINMGVRAPLAWAESA